MERITRTVKALEIKTLDGKTLLVQPEELYSYEGAVVVGLKRFKASMLLGDFVAHANLKEVK